MTATSGEEEDEQGQKHARPAKETHALGSLTVESAVARAGAARRVRMRGSITPYSPSTTG